MYTELFVTALDMAARNHFYPLSAREHARTDIARYIEFRYDTKRLQSLNWQYAA